MSKISSFIRSIILVAFVVTAAFLCGVRLLQMQLVDGDMYLQMTKETKVAVQEVDAARGQIVDRNGVVLNTNKTIYNINLQDSSLVYGTENDIIYRVLTILKKNGEEWNETLPITKTEPYRFLEGKERAVETLKSKLNIANYATVENCIYHLYDTYDISERYGEEMRRAIAGVRYEMTLKDFSEYNKFVLASGISADTVAELKELSGMLPGVDITESWERQYLNGELAAHARGTVGAISPEDYNRLKDQGYNLNDIIGTSGVEKALESVLRGERGTRSITRGADGLEISDEITKDPVAGNSVMTTIDSNFQQLVQDAVQYHIDYLHSPSYYLLKGLTPEYLEENGCYSGAAVVLDVKTGGVLAMASLPGYDINEYVSDYGSVISADYSPVFNRALDGTFRPGSTFKTITATAGLYEGAITPDSLITCVGRYTYFTGYQPGCEGIHNSINVRDGLKHSCNVFFYETARRMGINKLADWAARFGVGTDLGFELPMKTGQMSSMELYEQLGMTWNPGDVIQAGIGQCETLLTPMHMAVQAMTLANKGVRYQPHIVKSVYNYDFTEKLYDTEVVVAEDFSGYDNMENIMIEVREGMRKVASEVWGTYINGSPNLGSPFDYVGVGRLNACVKTGTPQASSDVTNSAIVAYYPADDPEIAIGIMMERGDRAIYLCANIMCAYANGRISTSYNEEGVPLGPL
ncbi:MAG: hypothetical protein K2N56_04640 [Oscillospiraceae bacterium]|nr:hypothetical protein [Oscillospiraceae bacterium]